MHFDCRLFGAWIAGSRCIEITTTLFFNKRMALGPAVNSSHRHFIHLVGAEQMQCGRTVSGDCTIESIATAATNVGMV